MGLFSSIGKGIKGIGHFLGKVASNPITQGIVGLTPLGIPGAILTGALGKLIAPGGNLGQAAQGALSGAAAGTAGQFLKGLPSAISKGGGISGIWSGTGTDAKGNFGLLGDLAGRVGGVTGLGSFLGGGAGGGGGGLDTIAKLGALGLSVADLMNAQTLGKRSNELATQALDTVNQNYAQNAGLRTAGRAGMLNPKIMDLSSLLSNAGPYAPKLPLGRAGTVGMGTFT